MNAQVRPNLWIGSEDTASPTYDRIVCASLKDILGCSLHVPIDEEHFDHQTEVCAVQAGRAVASWLRRDKSVLVYCTQGFNRSALIASIAMMTMGIRAQAAIRIVRAARGQLALTNPHYLALLHRLEAVNTFQLDSGI